MNNITYTGGRYVNKGMVCHTIAPLDAQQAYKDSFLYKKKSFTIPSITENCAVFRSFIITK